MQIIELILLIFIAWFLISQKNEGMAQLFTRRRKIILDSCALIDGRIIELTVSGFVADELVIPQFILNELQLLADGNDSHKRERARFGLDIAHQLQDASPTKVTIDRTVFPEASATDDKLVLLGKKLRAALYTTDYNLAKVAAVEGVRVLNVNELAQGLRPATLPGESLNIKIIQKGSNQGQGVGYLDDGTMIVVDGAARFVGKIVPITVTRMHQTVAGKMVFGQVQAAARRDDRHTDKSPVSDDAGKPKGSPAGQNKQTGLSGASGNSSKRSERSTGLHGRLSKQLRRRPTV